MYGGFALSLHPILCNASPLVCHVLLLNVPRKKSKIAHGGIQYLTGVPEGIMVCKMHKLVNQVWLV